MQMQSALKPLPLAHHGATPPETVVPMTRSLKSMPLTAMHMQPALKPLPLAHGETPSETAVPKTLSNDCVSLSTPSIAFIGHRKTWTVLPLISGGSDSVLARPGPLRTPKGTIRVRVSRSRSGLRPAEGWHTDGLRRLTEAGQSPSAVVMRRVPKNCRCLGAVAGRGAGCVNITRAHGGAAARWRRPGSPASEPQGPTCRVPHQRRRAGRGTRTRRRCPCSRCRSCC